MSLPAEHRVRDVHALLSDGTTARIRAAGPEDAGLVERFYARMSPDNLRLRFFSVGGSSAQQAARRLRAMDSAYSRTLVAEVAGRLVGIAEYVLPQAQRSQGASPSNVGAGADSREDGHEGERSTPPGDRAAEIALAVADAWHHRGIGTLLLEHLVDAARAAGITAFLADALSENHEMLKVFADLGLRTTRRFDGPEVHCTVRLEPDERYLEAVDARASAADVASMRPLLEPRSVAVVGAGREPGTPGHEVLKNLCAGGFTGILHAVNPKARAVAGVSCYPSVIALPSPPDLAVIAVPAHVVPDVAEECGEKGVRALLVLSSGLDATQSGALLAACRRYGMRLVGPNCLGLTNTDRDTRLDATFAARTPARGTAGVAVQSGGVGIAVLDKLSRLGIGVSTFASLGDKLDVSGNDMLQWWEADGRTELALLHLESFGNPRAFSRTARRVARRMPVLTVDAGRSEAGRRAAASHTAAAATPTMTRQALFTQAGVIATRSIGELLDTAALMHSQPLPAGDSVAVVSNAGGIGVLAADACAEAGLRLPPLGAVTGDLLELLPDGASAANPVDTTAGVSEEQLHACVEALARAVDCVLVVLVPTALAAATGENLLRAVTHAAQRGTGTVAVVRTEQTAPVALRRSGARKAVPSYADSQQAARALAHAVRYARWRARPEGTVPQPRRETSGAEGSRAIAAAFLSAHPEGGWLSPHTCTQLLDHYGIPQVPWRWAEDEDAAAKAAAHLAGEGHGRVALKAYWPGLLHKSDQNAVLLDITGEEQARTAYRDLATRFAGLLKGVVVQPMAPRGIELFAGVVQDEVFGPLVMFGHGGTATELLADHAARLAPLTDRDVHDLITSPRCAPLLFGYRGGGPVDLEGLERLLHQLSSMASDLPQLAEADLNPVLARPDGVLALDARVRLMPRAHRDPYLRKLR